MYLSRASLSAPQFSLSAPASPSNLKWCASWMLSYTAAALNMIFFGTQPTFTHVPPSPPVPPRSTTATRLP